MIFYLPQWESVPLSRMKPDYPIEDMPTASVGHGTRMHWITTPDKARTSCRVLTAEAGWIQAHTFNVLRGTL